jgi:DNA-binding NtrC family response regulator
MPTRPECAAWDWSLGAVVGETPEISDIFRIIQMAARTSHPVLVVGEPGTGKEVIAKAIHSNSEQRHLPFRVRECMSVRAVDLERELFSSADGSRGPQDNQCGTLFLDQIVNLNLDLQAILLRAIQRVESVASDSHIARLPRIIATSTRDLNLAVNEGTFRRDLYFRLNALGLRVPPLRERRRDIPLLTEALLRELSNAAACRFRLSDSALQAILTYDWPGNVRELKNCLQRSCCSASGPLIKLHDLPVEVSGTRNETDFDLPSVQVVPLSELEKRSIQETLKLVAGDKLAAARLLGIGKTTLYRKLKKYELQRQSQ